MKKVKGIALETIIARQLKKDNALKIQFDERRFYLQIAHLISDLRARSGLSQTELAKSAGVKQPLIARLEKGDQRRVPTFDTIYRILKSLGYQLAINIVPEKKAV
ncbi:MAG: helix-turn-helix domain-containing protein [Deltaproteobacteria bacterium]|nr:helix-turn-helix domain-containing protein [Deltaproteobacteria bacterium]